MPSEGRPKKILSKEEILNALDVCMSSAAAARYLKVSYNTFKKYAKLHNVWIQGGKNSSGKGIPRVHTNSKRLLSLEKLLSGGMNGKKLNLKKLKDRLVRELVYEEKCDNCGYDEKRITDQRAPLVLTFYDGDRQNYKKENMRLLCYNCRHNLVGNLTGKQMEYIIDPTSGNIIEKLDLG